MAARSRPRAGQLKDEYDEERSLWNAIKTDGRRIDSLITQSDHLQEKIINLSNQQDARLSRGDSPSSSVNDELEKALRENIRISNQLQSLIKSDSGNDICTQLGILSALREESNPPPTSRATSVGKAQRDRQNKRKLTDATSDDRDSIAADSPGPGPSPKVVINQKERLMHKSGSSRAGSVPVREGSVKEEDKDESSKEPKQRLLPGTEVLYRNPKSRPSSTQEGEGILCRVTSVIGEGKQRRYEIIDDDPDPPTPSIPYRASVNHLVPIPPIGSNMGLADLPPRKNVFALYPGTTTFYKAEVVAGWKAGGGSSGAGAGNGASASVGVAVVKREDSGEGHEVGEMNFVRLRFEGEDEADREMTVERRYVLPDK